VKKLLTKEFKDRPALDFLGPFFAVAVKEGQASHSILIGMINQTP
jgi:hypothetical protein